MADYKDIVGTAVRNNAGNLSADQKDQIFYDSTNVDFKYQFEAKADAWRTGVPLNTASWSRIGCGSTTSALANSGEQTPPQGAALMKITEIWNGTSWTETTDTTVSHYGGNGSHGVPGNTAALIFAGYHPSIPGDHGNTEEWNGSSWTELNNINTTRRFPGGNGTTTEACLVYGGLTPPQDYTNTELWNGTSWTEVNDLNTARYGTNGIGSSTSAAYIGGSIYPGPQPSGSFNELWNGTSWTEGTDANQKTHGAGSGIVNTAMLIFGGNPTGYTERWNGSSWTETTDLNEARDSQGGTGAGGSTSALSIGGVPPGGQPNGTASVEEFAGNQPIGGWSTGNSMNTARSDLGGAGTQTAALAFGGYTTTAVANTESYDGTSWTEVNDLNTARDSNSSSRGSYSSTLYFMQDNPSTSGINESWNGTSWTEVTALNTARRQGGGLGADNESALAIGGTSSPPTGVAICELWGGSSWTEVGDLNNQGIGIGGAGIVTAGLAVGRRRLASPATWTGKTESWNGTSWTETGDLNTNRAYPGVLGTYTLALACGGGQPTRVDNVEDWNGTSWAEVADLSSNRSTVGPGGNTTSGVVFGGYATAVSALTEEWSGSSNTIKVLTD